MDLDLDNIDLNLLAELQRNGRATNPELSERVHLSPTACFHRVRKLQESGYITNFTAILNPAKLNCALMVFVEIVLDRTTPAVFQEFADSVRMHPEILECHMVAGGFDYLIKARVADMDAYRSFLGNALTQLPGVRETHTYAVIEEIKADTTIPLPGVHTRHAKEKQGKGAASAGLKRRGARSCV